MEKWGIWMGKIKEGGKGRKKEKKERLFICAVIFLIFGITIGCGGYVDDNGNIVESSDAERDSIFYQNKELTQFDVDVYQYFKKYERDYADMISFRKDLPGRVILIIDEGSPITPWDILDFKMKEDGSLEFEIVEKNKNGEIKLNKGDILIGWVDRFYIKSGKDIPPEYIRWVNFFGKVTSVVSDRNKRVLLVYTEPIDLGYVISRISLENIYLDWADIIEEANSPQAPKFDVVRVSSPLEAKSFGGKKRILLKFSTLRNCLEYTGWSSPKYITIPTFSVPIEFEFGKDTRGKIYANITSTREKWGRLGDNIPTNIIGLGGYVEYKVKPPEWSRDVHDRLLRIELSGRMKSISGKRECVALEWVAPVGNNKKSFYGYLNRGGAGDAENLYEGYPRESLGLSVIDFITGMWKVFTFKEQYSGLGFDLDLNFRFSIVGEEIRVGGKLKKGERVLKSYTFPLILKLSRKKLLIVPFQIPFLYGEFEFNYGWGAKFGSNLGLEYRSNYNKKGPVKVNKDVIIGRRSFVGISPKDIITLSLNCNALDDLVSGRLSSSGDPFDQLLSAIDKMWNFKIYRCRRTIEIKDERSPREAYVLFGGEAKGGIGVFGELDITLNLGIPNVLGLGIGLGVGGFLGGLVKGRLPTTTKIQLIPRLEINGLDDDDSFYLAGLMGLSVFFWFPIFKADAGTKRIFDVRLKLVDRPIPFWTFALNPSGFETELFGGKLLREKKGNLGTWNYKSELNEEVRKLLSDFTDKIKEEIKKK
jgi:hypothetical protein